MKHSNVLMVILFSLTSPMMTLAVEQDLPATSPNTAVPETVTAAPVDPDKQHARHEQGMKHKGGCRHKGQGGMKRGGGHKDKHAQVVQRLDMIEARMAKIEVMLESLMKR